MFKQTKCLIRYQQLKMVHLLVWVFFCILIRTFINILQDILPFLPHGLFPDVSTVFARLEEMESVNAGLQRQLEALHHQLDALSPSSESPDLSHTFVQTAVTGGNAMVTTCSSVNGETSSTMKTWLHKNENSRHAADIVVPVIPGVDERALLEGVNPTDQGKAYSTGSSTKHKTHDRMSLPKEMTKYIFLFF